ncbi:hypothetical protein JI739_01560 [Ramlibacter sp. AW1]|uniref:Uncharacterized protein n=1 Tax=Ramlibacter aurantiacus TaxID=2801330 RepID=A0A936ZDN5_9BURK|nr:hypothetical protein [Ramlibacter aurantiacus]MBL0419022.1 hypothetical protein [Ramlibacter aurantiacus]
MSRRARRWLAIALLVAGSALVAASGLQAWHAWQLARRLEAGEIRVETLRGWMTLPYIAQVYGVPEARLREAIGAPPLGGDERSLRTWFSVLQLDPLTGRQRLEQVILDKGRTDG